MCVCVFVFNSWTQPWPTWVCLQIDPRKSEEMTILRGSKERTLQPARFTWFQRWEIYIESSALSGSHHLGNKKSRSDVRQDIIKCQKSLTKCGNGVSWSTCKTRKLLTLTELSKIRAKVLKLPTWYIIICSANLAQPHAPPNQLLVCSVIQDTKPLHLNNYIMDAHHPRAFTSPLRSLMTNVPKVRTGQSIHDSLYGIIPVYVPTPITWCRILYIHSNQSFWDLLVWDPG